MIESMNTHKYLEMIEIQETYKDILRIVIAEAGVSESGPQLTEESEPNETLRSILNESKAIEVGDDSQVYEILFEDYIAYAVTNESYAAGVIPEEYTGRLARVYSKSAFLNYIKQGTIATSEYPGEFMHYGFCCLNQIVDVVSQEPPVIKLKNA